MQCSSLYCDSSLLVDAHKSLWQHWLEELGLSFTNRRDSDKCSVSDAILGDIIVAFDALDNASKLPAIFVEATDLLSIPPVVLDPIAKKLSENTFSIDCLTSVVSQLSEKFSLPPADTFKTTLDNLASNIQTQLESLCECLSSLPSISAPYQALRFPLLDSFLVLSCRKLGLARDTSN